MINFPSNIPFNPHSLLCLTPFLLVNPPFQKKKQSLELLHEGFQLLQIQIQTYIHCISILDMAYVMANIIVLYLYNMDIIYIIHCT